MSTFMTSRLEDAVERLLQRNSQLQDLCERMLVEQETWRSQRQDVLAEVEELLAELALLREQQS